MYIFDPTGNMVNYVLKDLWRDIKILKVKIFWVTPSPINLLTFGIFGPELIFTQ